MAGKYDEILLNSVRTGKIYFVEWGLAELI